MISVRPLLVVIVRKTKIILNPLYDACLECRYLVFLHTIGFHNEESIIYTSQIILVKESRACNAAMMEADISVQ